MPPDITHCPALLVIELGAPAPVGTLLPTEVASALADLVAADLARLVPEAATLDLALSGAPLDPAQVLRPGWPVFAELGAQLARTRRGAGARIVAFGSAGGRMVSTVLEPEAGLGAGALVVLPLVLGGPRAVAQRVGTQLEEILHEQGLAGAAVALLFGQSLGLAVVHARYFTHRDLAALVALQLEHVGCASAWTLLESALFDAGRATSVEASSGQRWLLDGERVRGVALGLRAWLAGPGRAVAASDRTAAFAAWQAEQRRHAALFAAHGLSVSFVDGARDDAPLPDPWLLEVDAGSEMHGELALRAHEAPGLGTWAFSATRSGRAIAVCYPLDAAALVPAREALRAAVGAARDTAVERTRDLPLP